MMYDDFDSIIQPLISYTCTGLYNENMHKKISQGEWCHMYSYMNFIKICDNKIHEHIDLLLVEINDEINYDFGTIQTLNNSMESSEKIITYPIYGHINDENHIMSLIIDKERKQVIFYDPNGINKNTNDIENTLRIFIRKFNIEYNYQLIVIPTILWNKNNLILNKQYINSPVYHGGFCLILSILIPHFMLLTGKDIIEVTQIFESFTEINLMSLLNNYSLFYYAFITI
mgnify:FL=1